MRCDAWSAVTPKPRADACRGVSPDDGMSHIWITALDAKNFLIVLDGDDAVLKTISRIAGPYYQVRTTRDSRTLLGWMQESAPVDVIVTEHVLRTSSGVALLDTARSCRPSARRVLMTTYHDLASIVTGLHSGAIERLVPKPFTSAEFLAAILPEGHNRSNVNQRASA